MPTNTPRPTATPSPTATPDLSTSKTGVFTRSDQGKINPIGAIQWTVTGPQGPFSTLTITDTVPAGANWAINSTEIVPSPAGATVNCTATSVEIVFSNVPYGVRPSATILGDVTEEFEGTLLSFSNTASFLGGNSTPLGDAPWTLVQTPGGDRDAGATDRDAGATFTTTLNAPDCSSDITPETTVTPTASRTPSVVVSSLPNTGAGDGSGASASWGWILGTAMTVVLGLVIAAWQRQGQRARGRK